MQGTLALKNTSDDKKLKNNNLLIDIDIDATGQQETDVNKSQEKNSESFDAFLKIENESVNKDEKYENSVLSNNSNVVKNDLFNNLNDDVSLKKKAALLTVTDTALNKLNDKEDFKGEVFNIVKQANELISEDNKNNITNSLSINIDQLLSFNWTLFVPAKGQYSDSKYSYCLKVLDEMRAGLYQVQTPFKINLLDKNEWKQHLDGVTLVQVNDVELELYTIKDNATSFNAVASVFNADKILSTILPGVSSTNDQFFGVFAYSDFNQQSVGGAGRFYSKDTIKNIQSYLIKWNLEYYLLNAEVKDKRYRLLEIIPLLTSQQKRVKNCRWRH